MGFPRSRQLRSQAFGLHIVGVPRRAIRVRHAQAPAQASLLVLVAAYVRSDALAFLVQQLEPLVGARMLILASRFQVRLGYGVCGGRSGLRSRRGHIDRQLVAVQNALHL